MKQLKNEAIEETVETIKNIHKRYGFEIQNGQDLGRIEIDMLYSSIDKVTFYYNNHWWEMQSDFIDTDGEHYYQFKIIQQ